MELNTIKRRLPVADWSRFSYLYSEHCVFIKSYKQAINKYVASLALLMANPKSNAAEIKKSQTEIWREKVKSSNQILNSLTQFQLKNADWERLTYTYLRIIEMKELQDKLKGVTTKTTPIVMVKNKELNSLAEMEEVLIKALTDLKVNEGLISCEIQWLDKAIVPDEPYFPTLTMSIIISILLSFCFCFLVAYGNFIWENYGG